MSVQLSATIASLVAPQLVASPSIVVNTTQGAPKTPRIISLTNLGSGSIRVTASSETSSGGNWLTITSQPDTVTNGAGSGITMAVDSSTLGPGVYTGTVIATGVSALLSTPASVIIPVTVTVSSNNHVIQVSQTGLTFTAIAGGGKPLPQSISISNIGAGSMNWSAQLSAPAAVPVNWLSLTPPSGTTVAGADASSVFLTVDPAGLLQGSYFAQIKIVSDADNSPQILTVSLVVKPAGSPSVSEVRPTALIFNGTAGSSPGSQFIKVSTLGSQSVSYSSTRQTQDGQNWLNHVPAANTIVPGQAETIVVQPDFSALSAGIYYGSIPIVFSDGTTASINVVSIVSTGPKTSGIVHASLRPLASPTTKTCKGNDFVLTLLPDNSSGPLSFVATPGGKLSASLDTCDHSTVAFSNCSSLKLGTVTVNAIIGGKPYCMNHEQGNMLSVGWPPLTTKDPTIKVSAAALELTGNRSTSTEPYTARLQSGVVAPQVAEGGIVNSAFYQKVSSVGLGGLVTIFGSSLADAGGVSGGFPAPFTLAGTKVTLQNTQLPILYASDGQLNVQIPYDVNPNVSQSLTVVYGNAQSSSFQLPVATAQPAIFGVDSTSQGKILNAAGDVVDSAHAARQGDTVTIFCSGLGPVTPPVPVGVGAPGPTNLVNPAKVFIGNMSADITYSGLVAGSSGLYQIITSIPAGVASGDTVPVTVQVSTYTSPIVTISVR
jgi:uncharacterized protein (TIGR03437 family)